MDCSSFNTAASDLIMLYSTQISKDCPHSLHSFFCHSNPRFKIPRTSAETSRLSCVLAFLGTHYLCLNSIDIPKCCEHSWSQLPLRLRKGWSEFTLAQVENAVLCFIEANKSPPAVNLMDAESILSCFHNLDLLALTLCPKNIQMKHLKNIALVLADFNSKHISCWSDVLTQYALGLEVLSQNNVSVLLCFFFLFSFEDSNSPPVLFSAICNILHRCPRVLLPKIGKILRNQEAAEHIIQTLQSQISFSVINSGFNSHAVIYSIKTLSLFRTPNLTKTHSSNTI